MHGPRFGGAFLCLVVSADFGERLTDKAGAGVHAPPA